MPENYLCPVSPQRHQRLLHVMSARMHCEQIRPGQGCGEDAGLGVHATTEVSQTA